MADPDPSSKVGIIEKRIKYYGGDEVVAIFADLAIFSHGTGNFTISFYQMLLPESDDIQALKDLGEVPAKCVSRIVLSPTIVDQFSAALATNAKTFKEVQSRRSSLPSSAISPIIK